MTWFRDYVYFPLGGSRCSKWKIIRNIFIVWAISGLWHGANWTFVCWGLFHAALLAVYNIFGLTTKYKHIVAHNRYLPNIKELAQMTLTFFLAVIGWIIFRAESITQAVDYFSAMVNNKFFDPSIQFGRLYLVFGFLLLLIEWMQRNKQHALQFPSSKLFSYRPVRWFIYYAIILIIIEYAGSDQTFIYFQF
jgi:hypothetical protein